MDLRDLLSDLEGDKQAAIVMGRLKQERVSARDGCNWSRFGYNVSKRSTDFYKDAPSRLFAVDVDDLECDDVEDVAAAIENCLHKHAPELHDCGHIWQHTGSSGLPGKGVRVRLWFLLEEPRTLAAMRSFVQSVNQRAGSEVFDLKIYSPEHLIFTSAPQLLNADGKPYRRPVPTGVWHVAGDVVPADAFPELAPNAPAPASSTALRAESLKLTKTDAAAALRDIGPGNFNTPIHAWISHVAWTAPAHALESVFASAVNMIRKKIQETSEPAGLEQRLREHGCERKLRKKWEAALERKRETLPPRMASAAVVETVLPSLGNLRINTAGAGTLEELPPEERRALQRAADAEDVPAGPQPVAAVRSQMHADFAAIVDRVLIDGERGHWLFTQPPGTGKSALLKRLSQPGFLSRNLVRISVPTHALAAELVAMLRAAALGQPGRAHYHGDLDASIRHHKGRTQPGMCLDDVSRPKAERAESLGLSIRGNVCLKCASRDACRWFAQDADNAPGVIVEPHAATVGAGPRRSDLTVVDESIAGAILASNATPVAALGFGGRLRFGKMQALDVDSTAKLRGFRELLIAALDAVVLACDKPSEIPLDGWSADALSEAIGLEERFQRSLALEIFKKEGAGRECGQMRNDLAASRHAAALYGLIATSVEHQRQRAFGVAVFAGGKQRMVKYAVRKVGAGLYGAASVTFDGTADADVWRALVAPDGAAFEGEVFRADVLVPDGVSVTQHIDKTGARSAFLPDLRVTEAETAAEQSLGALGASWARAALGDEVCDQQAAQAAAVVATAADERRAKKRRSDSHFDLISRFATFQAVDTLSTQPERAPEIDGRKVAVLLVAQNAVADIIRPLVPGSVAVENFGALRGLNRYEHVPVVAVVGRPRPANIDLELMTEALHAASPAAREIERYDVAPKEGRPWLEQHPDDRVAALQSQITAAGVQQAVARARIYNRSLANPVAMHVFGQEDTGLPSDRVAIRCWSDAERTPVEIAAARGCVFSDMRLNQRAYPGVFPKGAKDGRGQVDREGKRKFDELLANLARSALGREIGPYPYKESREESPGSLLALRTVFASKTAKAIGDALDYSGGTLSKPRHKLVRLRIPGTGSGGRGSYASYAIVGANWTASDVAQLVGAPVEHWSEQTVDQLRALADRFALGAFDGR
ncbi:hypothetical protein APY04_1860 [Hyphomicrobium sulfonivorans]|uniref:Uncharacterized protein n=1 Tax=Hyphomicrobium sulfonivorans TaxID=121290 RepID=A0A109BEY2_HYPSL|nr:hypothetical protein APY04_1860 [Hyphomicrobium sulfonivorans]